MIKSTDKRLFVVACLMFASAFLAIPLSVSAENLRSALLATFHHNPDLLAARAMTDEARENIIIARSGGLPNIYAGANYGISPVDTARPGDFQGIGNAGLRFNYQLFDGYKTKNRVLQAEAGVDAATQQVAFKEQQILLEAVRAYADVEFYRLVLRFNERTTNLLRQQLRSIRQRRSFGDATFIEESQSEARVAGEQTNKTITGSQLQNAAARYEQIVGHRPATLDPISVPGELMPTSLQAAKTEAMANHPALLAALYRVEVAEKDLEVARAEKRVQISLSGNIGYRHSQEFGNSATEKSGLGADVLAQLKIPLYTGGRLDAIIRQKTSVVGRMQQAVDSARRRLKVAIDSAWVEYQASDEAIRASRLRTKSQKESLRAIKDAYDAGQRNNLQVLDAATGLLNAQIAMLNARRSQVMAAYKVLAAMGRLSGSQFGLGKPDKSQEIGSVGDPWHRLRQ